MRVLFVSPVVPWPPESGGRMRTYNLLKALSGRAEIHLRAVLEPGQEDRALDPLRACCASAMGFERSRPSTLERWKRARIERWFHSPTLQAKLVDDLAHGHFDLVHLDELLLVRTLPDAPNVPVIVHHHKLDTVLHELLPARAPLAKQFDVWKLHRLEAESARRFRHHVVCSLDDARILGERHPELVLGAVESGFDPEYFAPSVPPPPRSANRLLFVGSMNYTPNVDAVLQFVDNALPGIVRERPDVVLDVVGAEPPREVLALESPHVHVEGLVADVRPYLERAAALVIPLRIGGGTRLKLVEAVAMNCPVISTSIGAQGLAFRDDEHVVLAADGANFTRATLALLADPARAAERAARARKLALATYPWSRLAERLLECWRRAAEPARRTGTRG
ncbi:MAG: glycosyltransferase family 4 protein [Planctomycetes bacterium]|nr:glycosyltransferase family 4 protein [Planctomycetota bacterium]